MAGEADHDRWEQLGRMLERRRYEMDPGYRSLTRFTEERGIDYRLCWDIEHARRTNFRRATLADIAQAYMLDTWAIEEFINDGTPLPQLGANPYAGDPELAELWSISSGLEPSARHGVVELARQMRDGKGAGTGHAGAEGNGTEGAV